MILDQIQRGDCLEVLRAMPDNSVDLILGSPPYEDARTYGIGFRLKGQEWVDWMVARWFEMQRVSRGLVVMVVEGKTRNFRWSATPALLMADLHRAGFNLRKPPIYSRVGIPGSGGPDYFRNDYEFCVVTCRPGKLHWSDNTACGHPPKYGVGGACSNRTADGRRMNREKFGDENGNAASKKRRGYAKPAKANPGNVIHCKVGGGLMGSLIAHENEAPFPESLVEPFVLSFVPPGGIVLDPFCGSGTVPAVAVKTGRHWIGIDVRESQVDATSRRVTEARGLKNESGAA